MDDEMLLKLLKLDLQRTGDLPGDRDYLPHLLLAAKARLTRQGARDDGSEDYIQAVVGTAAWMYRKRITGEGEPAYLKCLRRDIIISQRIGGGGDA